MLSRPSGAGAVPFPVNAGGFQPALFPSIEQVRESVELVNSTMGPTRLTGSPEHTAYVDHLAQQFAESGLTVGTDTYTFPRWTAKSWGLWAGNQRLPVSSYYPHSNGFYSGTRDANGNYPDSGITQPTTSVTGTVINLGAWTAPNSVPWASANGKIAYIDYPVASLPLATWSECRDAGVTRGYVKLRCDLSRPHVPQ